MSEHEKTAWWSLGSTVLIWLFLAARFTGDGRILELPAGLALANDLALLPILIGATPEQKKRLVTPFTEKLKFTSFCLTEPAGGSDAAALRTRADRQPDGSYRLTGTKIWISNAPEADRYLVFGTLDPAAGAKALRSQLFMHTYQGSDGMIS